ncbi:GNAT family N-acetyltransferase [Nocardia sp. NBC_01009]|uniref:GNAT family N-acetyltransferase n=1 Tax=Nocardia sp. NBC_01009 TaxID=2975996 RepID=UPI0038688E67|nr:GNAT family N-acetyltransferase [Nocardia sp. NBC_01009]
MLGEAGIRRLTAEDWAGFRDIRLRALADAPSAFGSTLAWAQARTEQDWRRLLAQRAQFLASAGGVDIGTVGGLDDVERDGAHLISMWVAPEARGTGVSGLLMRAVIAWAAEAGYRAVWLEVSDGNTAAERLYLRHGFVRTGVHGPIAEGDPRLEFEMVRRL